MQDRAGPREPLRTFPHDPPLLPVKLLALGNELIQLPFRLELDFKLGNIEVLGVVQLPKQRCVYEFGYPLSYSSGVLLLGNVEEDHLSGKTGVDEINQFTNTLVLDLLLEKVGERMVKNLAVLQSIPEVLGERALA